ncbi:paraneoplastic antigen Ma1 homolog [Acipenser ruthenus]|uniref:paraneoplastic antigen Ma1 homolog n=1 Tax=Acipenser ruthenus TaxID=7906 RepID=UPI002741A3C7|nr:paraneoplastic antigen Ma1 homolog [Acipenser ruthenus]
MDQARLMVQECYCSSREKRKRIGESLKGPALEIIQAVRDANPDASPMDYLEALERTFGTPESAWTLVVANGATIDPGEGVPTSSFQEKLTKLLQEEGKTLREAQALYPAEALQTTSPEAIIRAVGDVLEKTAKSHNETNAYRRLRTFSGSIPTPSGEEGFDSWMDQARLMVQECYCSSREKRKRIGESLKGPALEIIQAVRDANPDASPMDYLEALERTFGTPESGEDLYFAFRSLRQQPGEKLSDFLRRLERSFKKVVLKGGIASSRIDLVRIEQLIRGATESELMLIQVRLRERKDNPLAFLTLLNEIRKEEEQEAARHKLSTSVKRIQVRDDENLKRSVS